METKEMIYGIIIYSDKDMAYLFRGDNGKLETITYTDPLPDMWERGE
jgi:hypothetical protein